jgi:hypothetical protein
MGSGEVRDLIEQAAVFARAGAPSEATARARLAVARATDPDSYEEATAALERFEADERRWREAIEARTRAPEERATNVARPVERSPRIAPVTRRRGLWRAVAA